MLSYRNSVKDSLHLLGISLSYIGIDPKSNLSTIKKLCSLYIFKLVLPSGIEPA